jgi:hypothetical protein
MIHYQLRCAADHAFDGWFASSTGFDAQVARGLVQCPICDSRQVSRALMAPSINSRKGDRPTPEPEPAPPEAASSKQPVAVTNNGMPAQVRAMLQKLRGEVERACDYVGPDFAEEARRIHYGETAPRGIYGETTPDEAEALAEEGIGIARIPWVPKADG